MSAGNNHASKITAWPVLYVDNKGKYCYSVYSECDKNNEKSIISWTIEKIYCHILKHNGNIIKSERIGNKIILWLDSRKSSIYEKSYGNYSSKILGEFDYIIKSLELRPFGD